MRRGKSRMGWKTPTTLGSRIAVDEKTGISSIGARGDAARNVALTWRHPVNQRKTTHADPSPHRAQSAFEIHSAGNRSAETVVGISDVGLTRGSQVNGSFTC